MGTPNFNLPVLSGSESAKVPRDFNALAIAIDTVLATLSEQTSFKVTKGDFFLNIKDFGAKSDGVTDDTDALRRAHDALPSTGGGIFIPIGTTCITNVTFSKPLTLVAAGYVSILKVSGTLTAPVELSKKMAIKDLKLVGVGNSILLNMSKTWSPSSSVTFEIKNVWFHNQDGLGKLLQIYGARESGVTDCWFTSGLTNGTSQTEAIVFLADSNGGAMNINVSKCKFHHLKTGIDIRGDVDNHQMLAGLRLIDNMMISVINGYRAAHADYIKIEQSMLDFVDKPIYADRIANLKIRHNYFAARNDFNDAIVVENSKNKFQMHWLDIADNRIFSYANVSAKGNGIVLNANGGKSHTVTFQTTTSIW